MKMKKLVALATAAALCLGMSVTAFAADVKSPQDKDIPEIEYGATDDGLHVWSETLTDKEKEDIAAAAEKALKDQYDVAGKDVVVLGVGDYTLYDKDGKKIEDGKVPNGGADFYFSLGYEDKEGYTKGATIYVAHQKADGTWEILEGTLVKDRYGWSVKVNMSSFSPVAFLKVMSNGKIVEVNKKGEPVKATTARSPRTGE